MSAMRAPIFAQDGINSTDFLIAEFFMSSIYIIYSRMRSTMKLIKTFGFMWTNASPVEKRADATTWVQSVETAFLAR